jgi:hypothetical protein
VLWNGSCASFPPTRRHSCPRNLTQYSNKKVSEVFAYCVETGIVKRFVMLPDLVLLVLTDP